jgi:hypothetical protein
MMGGKQPLTRAFERVAVLDLTMNRNRPPMVVVAVLDFDLVNETDRVTEIVKLPDTVRGLVKLDWVFALLYHVNLSPLWDDSECIPSFAVVQAQSDHQPPIDHQPPTTNPKGTTNVGY